MNFEKHVSSFIQKVGTYKNGNTHYDGSINNEAGGYPRHSIMFFEALLLYTLAKEHNINIFIESGVRLGGSTSIWGRVFKDIEVYSVEKNINKTSKKVWDDIIMEKLSPMYPNINLIQGDGNVELIKIIESNPDKKIGILVDGPKGTEGIKLAEKCLSYKNVCFSSLHDFGCKKYFSTFNYNKLNQLVKSVNVLNEEHPGFEKNPRGYNLTILEKNDN